MSSRHLLVAGGGGAANTGVKNGFEIFEIINNGENIVGESVTRYSAANVALKIFVTNLRIDRRHFTGEFSVYSLGVRGAASSNNNLPHSVVVAAGHNEFCQLYKLTLQR